MSGILVTNSDRGHSEAHSVEILVFSRPTGHM